MTYFVAIGRRILPPPVYDRKRTINPAAKREDGMKNKVSAETARIAYEAMACKIAGDEITEEQQKAIDEMSAFREEYVKAKEEYGKVYPN